MTERDYLSVTALQLLRAAHRLTTDAQPQKVRPELRGQWERTLKALGARIATLEDDVDHERPTTETTPPSEWAGTEPETPRARPLRRPPWGGSEETTDRGASSGSRKAAGDGRARDAEFPGP